MRRLALVLILAVAACSGADRNPVVPDPSQPVVPPSVPPPIVAPTPTPTPTPTRTPPTPG
jgi:hypothetical protein